MAVTTTERENVRIARQVPEDVATEGDLDLVEDVYAADAIEHDPFGDHEGVEEIREGMAQLRAAFPDFSATVEDVFASGDRVAMRVTLRGTHEGEMMGVEATGKSFEVQNLVITRIADGKIAERWVQPDTLGMLGQLGVVEVPWS